MNIKQANKSFDKLEMLINKIIADTPVNLINDASDEADSLKERMEEQIEKFENKKNLNEEQESTLDRFQSTIEAITNIGSILSSLKDAIDEFENMKENVEDAKTTI